MIQKVRNSVAMLEHLGYGSPALDSLKEALGAPVARTYWFVVCWTEHGCSYRAGPYEHKEEAEQAARMAMTRDGQTVSLMETVPQLPLPPL
jgi:hypothetical protein